MICLLMFSRVNGNTTEVTNISPQLQRNFSSNVENSEEERYDKNEHQHVEIRHEPDYKTWLAASGSILVISFCGVFGLLIIPVMQKFYYQHVLQFLIAMAVGTLTGDAFLHLLPHALLPDTHHHLHGDTHHLHTQAVWMGVVAAVSLIGFFFVEKLINIFGEMKASSLEKQLTEDMEKNVKVVREGHEASDKARGNIKCMNKYSNYCVTNFETEHVGNDGKETTDDDKPSKENTSNVHIVSESGLSKLNNNSIGVADDDKESIVIISQHETAHHGHSHVHTHLHSAPRNIPSVAWMVLLGDGVHNMADGLAIGAAFASGYLSGVSTSVAVLCHELPHEIGDFALLLKAGMTTKQAIFYNLVSSVLSLVGMVAGVLLGTSSNITPWIFSSTAGIFLYVALVDMVPELSSGHAHPITKHSQMEGHWVVVVLQLVGMVVGVSIMLVIALYEHEMFQMFVESNEEIVH